MESEILKKINNNQNLLNHNVMQPLTMSFWSIWESWWMLFR